MVRPPHRLLLLLLACLVCGLGVLPAWAADLPERLVIAHAMMTQPVYGRSVADYRREIADARAVGIDGFALEVFGFETHRASQAAARSMFEAAETSDPGFKLFLMLSVPGKASGNWTAAESNFMSPVEQPPAFFRNPAVPTWTHRGFAELSTYYARWFKTGQAPPVEREAVFFFYRQHPKDLPTFPADQCAGWNKEVQLHGDVRDDLHVTTVLAAPGELRVLTGGGESRRTVPSGIHHHRIPFALGVPVFELVRDGTVIARKAGRLAITDAPATRNFHVYGDYAYAGTVKPEARPDTAAR